MLQKTIASYGGAYVDLKVVEDPTSQISAANFNRLAEDVAQLTITGIRAAVRFPLVASGASTVSSAWSNWGAGSGIYPTVARTGTGVYTVTYSATQTDGLAESETVGFIDADGGIRSATVFGQVNCVVTSGNVVTVYVANSAGTLADLTVGTIIGVWIR